MNRSLRVVRGILGTAIVWSAAWFVVSALLAASVFTTTADVRESGVLAASALSAGLFFGIVGAFSGAAFAFTLAVVERRTRFASLSMLRVVAWGAIGGLVYPGLAWLSSFASTQTQVRGIPSALVLCAILGGLSAGAMLAIARRGQVSVTDAHFAELEAPKVTDIPSQTAERDNLTHVGADGGS